MLHSIRPMTVQSLPFGQQIAELDRSIDWHDVSLPQQKFPGSFESAAEHDTDLSVGHASARRCSMPSACEGVGLDAKLLMYASTGTPAMIAQAHAQNFIADCLVRRVGVC